MGEGGNVFPLVALINVSDLIVDMIVSVPEYGQ